MRPRDSRERAQRECAHSFLKETAIFLHNNKEKNTITGCGKLRQKRLFGVVGLGWEKHLCLLCRKPPGERGRLKEKKQDSFARALATDNWMKSSPTVDGLGLHSTIERAWHAA